jgi:rhodanese-related sulfurtransferase
MLKQKDFALINVHMPYEGEIDKTDLFIPYNTIAVSKQKLPSDKNAKLVVYCRTGRMSKIAVQKLVSLCYRNIYDLAGGMEAWQADGNVSY